MAGKFSMDRLADAYRRWPAISKSLLHVLGIFLLAAAVIGAVFRFGDIPNRERNGFKRNYLTGVYSGTQEREVQETLTGFAGTTGSTIYFTTSTEGEVLAIDGKLQGQFKRIRIPFFARWKDSLQYNSLAIQIDSPRIYLFAENKPAIIKTRLDSSICEISILPPGSFTREVMPDTDRFILRKVEPGLTDQIFVRYDLRTGLLTKEKDISQRYGDGGIISDGQLLMDRETKKLYYLYYYKNLLLSFDTSLRGATKLSSIDTTISFKVKTGLVRNGGADAFTNITPANPVNVTSDVQNGLLYNMSALKADNEPDRFFAANSIIDLIDLRKGNYLGSIVLPAVNGSKLQRFLMSKGRLIGMYTHKVVIYDGKTDLVRPDQ